MLEEKRIFKERYKIIKKIAQNAGRQTWLAKDLFVKPAKTVIIKFLAFGGQMQWDDLKLFEREADILKQISHPRIPKYRDYFSIEDKDNWFALVEKYIPGSSFKQLIENKNRFTEEELRKIASEVLEILCYLHTLNPPIIHRDIKPSNLMLGEDKKVYLIDFGAVQDNGAAQGATFTVVGTYGYAPVEQFGGRTVPASDLYALGATLIHLATGTIPADLPQTNMRIQFRDRVSLSANFVSWIERLTEPDIGQRFSSASQALDALNNRLAINSVYQIAKPHSSQIEFNKSSSNLEIAIPSREFKVNDLLMIAPCIITLILTTPLLFSSPLLAIIIWLLDLSTLSILLFPIYGKLSLRLNRYIFEIKWKLFGLTYKKTGNTSAINKVTSNRTPIKVHGEKIKIISIKAGTKKYHVVAFVGDVERKWLAEEIKDWLGF